ncbi:MAG: T9SS type A sorting domain-containing protein [Bacteroidetes bacterium]|nr:T9SS type A sorting domain-containing protein [Bacteroidota bacterium]
MKQIFTLVIMLLLVNVLSAQTETLAKWTFPNDNLGDTIAEEASALNTTAYLTTTGGTGAISMKNGVTTKAAQADGWDNGQGTKAWQIALCTTGYEHLSLSSKQQSGNTDPGPRDFKIQYKIGQLREWTDVENGTLTVLNDWTSGALNALPLPAEVNNHEIVFIRWILTSDSDINGNTLTTAGKTKIDDILVTGEVLTGINEPTLLSSVSLWPNPCNGQFNINAKQSVKLISVFNNLGQVVENIQLQNNDAALTLSLPEGMYVVVTTLADDSRHAQKLVVK